MFVACRLATEQDSCDLACVAYWSRGDVVHTELVLDERCPGVSQCKRCALQAPPERSTRTTVHRLTYVIVSAPQEYAHVILCLDRHLVSNPRYRYVLIPVNGPQGEIIKSFLDQQLDKPFNYLGFYLNFISCCCLGYRGGDKQRALRNSRWFCSELCVAALQQIDILLDYRPCKVSPTQLYDILVREQRCTPLQNIPPLAPPILSTPSPIPRTNNSILPAAVIY